MKKFIYDFNVWCKIKKLKIDLICLYKLNFLFTRQFLKTKEFVTENNNELLLFSSVTMNNFILIIKITITYIIIRELNVHIFKISQKQYIKIIILTNVNPIVKYPDDTTTSTLFLFFWMV